MLCDEIEMLCTHTRTTGEKWYPEASYWNRCSRSFLLSARSFLWQPRWHPLIEFPPLKQSAQDKTWSQNFPSSFSLWLLARALSSCDRHHYLHLGTSYHCEWQLIGHSTRQDPFLKSSSSSSFCSRKRVQVVPTQHKTTATEVWRRALNQYLYLSHQLPVINNRTQTHTHPLIPTITRVQYFDWFISIHYAP